MKSMRGISQKEASGVLTLIVVILFVQTTIFIFYREKKEEEPLSKREEVLYVKEEEIASVIENSTAQPLSKRKSNNLNVVPDAEEPCKKKGGAEIFEFDPNSVTLQDLIRLGLSERQAAVVVRYREKGGVFREREEFKKIYTLPEGFYERVKDSIKIAPSINRNLNIVDMNLADSTTLLSLPGIGPYYASKIIGFREAAGGFAHAEQLMDIAGIDIERYNLFKNFIVVDSNSIIKRDIAETDIKELVSNPYIGAYLARAIKRFIQQNGGVLIKIFHLKSEKIIDNQLFEILKHYFH